MDGPKLVHAACCKEWRKCWRVGQLWWSVVLVLSTLRGSLLVDEPAGDFWLLVIRPKDIYIRWSRWTWHCMCVCVCVS